jgi:pseudouridine kinase
MKNEVVIIGAANVDINGFSTEPVNINDSNPGTIEYCPGGVGRNIAENLARLGTGVKLISVIGGDPGAKIITAADCGGLDLRHSLFLKDGVSSTYLALMDSNGEMRMALSDMSILEKMTKEHLERKAGIIAKTEIIVLDAGLTEDIMAFVMERFPGKTIFLDPVSARKAVKAKSILGGFHTIKMSRMEAECLSGTVINRKNPGGKAFLQSLEKAGERFISAGVRRVFITLGKDGIYYRDRDRSFFTPIRYVKPVNTSGGGDAFMAGVLYGSLNGFCAEKTVSFAAAMAALTVQSRTTVSREMCKELVEKTMRPLAEKTTEEKQT